MTKAHVHAGSPSWSGSEAGIDDVAALDELISAVEHQDPAPHASPRASQSSQGPGARAVQPTPQNDSAELSQQAGTPRTCAREEIERKRQQAVIRRNKAQAQRRLAESRARKSQSS